MQQYVKQLRLNRKPSIHFIIAQWWACYQRWVGKHFVRIFKYKQCDVKWIHSNSIMTTSYTLNIAKKNKRNRYFAIFQHLRLSMHNLGWTHKKIFKNLFSQLLKQEAFVVQWLSHLSSTQKVPGSIPGQNINLFCHFYLNFVAFYQIECPKLGTTQFSAVFSIWQA